MSSTTLTLLNNYLINNRTKLNKDSFKDSSYFKANKTTIIDNTIISYSKELSLIFCSNYSINLTKSSYLKHLKIRHNSLYINYKNNLILDNIANILEDLEITNLESLERKVRDNKVYFNELPLILNGFKCLSCNYISINYKAIRQHFNLEYNNPNNKSKAKANYILDNIPL